MKCHPITLLWARKDLLIEDWTMSKLNLPNESTWVVSFFSNQTTTLHYVLFASVVLAEKLTTQSRSTLPRCCTQQHNCSVNVVSSTSLQPPMYYHTYKYCKMDLAHIMYHYGFDDGYDTTIASWLLLLFFCFFMSGW